MVYIPKYISFNSIFRSRAGRKKHYCVLAVRSTSHRIVIKRLKAKIPVRTTRVDLRNEQLLKCVYNTRYGVQVPTNKHSPCSQRNISSLLTGASCCQKDIPNCITLLGRNAFCTHCTSAETRSPTPHCRASSRYPQLFSQ